MDDEDVIQVACQLNIDPFQIQQNLDRESFTVVVHEKWLSHVQSKGTLPSAESGIPKWTQSCRSALFARVARPWLKLKVTRVYLPARGISDLPQIPGERVMKSDVDFMEYMDAVAMEIYQSGWEGAYRGRPCTLNRFHNSLSEAVQWRSISGLVSDLYSCPVISAGGETGGGESVAGRTLSCSQLPPNGHHSNLVPVYCAVRTREAFFLLQPHHQYTVHDVTMFSPAMLGNSSAKLLFVIYQMLQAVTHCHRLGMSCGNISLSDFAINDKLWVQFCGPKLNDVISFCQAEESSQVPFKGQSDTGGGRLPAEDETQLAIQDETGHKEKRPTMESLPEIVQKWAMGQVSNYDYLMILNRLANRQMGNPNHHPVMPWVMDFTRPDGGYRDFSKSKFRLNKGDDQLDFTYDSALQMQALTEEETGLAAQVPYHISDVLSEITYYIYKARRTAKSLLCSHVRSVWVPNEYPASMQRLQSWTPDECIPEFFSDPDIFRSIHDDLSDLEVPSWCSGPEDFVEKHRAVLESPYVSERLHRWIDLTFGHKLSGPAAVRAKNVVLCVVDQHTQPASNGVVQLFNVPHPKRFSPSPYMTLAAPTIERPRTKLDVGPSVVMTTQDDEVAKLTEQEGLPGSEGPDGTSEQERAANRHALNVKDNVLNSAETDRAIEATEVAMEISLSRNRSQSFNNEGQNIPSSMVDESQLSKNPIRKLPFFRAKTDQPMDSRQVRPELATIALPDGYEPLSALNQLESLYSFTTRAGHSLPEQHQVADNRVQWQQLVARDTVALACTITELFLAPKLRLRQVDASLECRCRHLQRVVRTESQDLPGHIRELIQGLLKVTKGEDEDYTCPWDLSLLYQSGQKGLPWFSPSLLLQPHSRLVAFPQYFTPLYQFLSELHRQRCQAGAEEPHPVDLTDSQAMSMVQLARHWLSRVTHDISDEGKDLLLPYILGLFEDGSTAVYAALSLFSRYAGHLGPKLATDRLLAPLSHLLDSEFTSPDYLLLFQHSFLSQVIMCLGLKPFLAELAEFVTEATNGMKQCPMFTDVAGEQTCGLTVIGPSMSTNLNERESFLTTDGIAVEEELFGNVDGDEGDEEDANDEENVEEDSNGARETTVSGNSETQCDEEDENDDGGDNGASDSQIKKGNESPSDEQVSSLEDKPSDTISSDREADTLSINSGNMTSLSDQGDEDNVSQQLLLKDKSDRPREEEDQIFGSQKSADHFRVYKQQLSSKLYQINTLIGKSLSEVASESITWLVHRIGPALTVRYITPKLLIALSACYMEPQQLLHSSLNSDGDVDEMDTSSVCNGKKAVVGDINARSVLKCLTDVALLFGDQFIFQQYLPFIKETVRKVQRKVSVKLEGRLVASVVLLRHILPFLTDSVLMEKLQYLFGKFVHPLLDIMSCTGINFPSGSQVRSVVCFKLVDILNAIALRIGREMTRDHMTDILKRFFLCFKLASASSLSSPVSGTPPDYKSLANSTDSEDKYLVIEVDNETNQMTIGSPYGPTARGHSQDSGPEMSPTFQGLGTVPRPSSLGSQNDENVSLEDMKSTLQDVFTPELAHAAYIPLCRLTGSIYMERSLVNHEQIWALSSKHEKAMSTQLSPPMQSPLSDDGSLANSPISYPGIDGNISWSSPGVSGAGSSGRGTFGGHMMVVGNRIEPAFCEDEPPAAPGSTLPEGEDRTLCEDAGIETAQLPVSPRAEMNKSKRTLRGAWLSYWEQYLARKEHDNSLHFCQIKLQTFSGHTNGVKALCMMPNENSFLSASKDKKVKIWSLRNFGDGTAKSSSSLTYHHHRKTVFAVDYLESQRLVASCDGNVHVWDPINGAAVRGYDLSRNAPSCMEVMPAPSPCLMVSSSDAGVCLIDTRHGGVQHEIRVASGSLGLIRCMAISPDGYTLGVGLSSGVLSMVDLRTGLLLGGWQAHMGEIYQIKAHANHTFLTTSVDHSMILWREDSTKICNFRGPAEPVHCIYLADEQVLSATVGNRIGIHTAINAQASYSSSKLRPDTFRGAISALSVLPVSKLLLVASDNGSVFLLA
ncbi:WD repeat-containing protein 81-like [Diadema antillarum]|uniref:WD repeat-containing protein 81-like n=1 Tax=Diadema antillarum TaxID=105358 RepID=UPI003A8A311D